MASLRAERMASDLAFGTACEALWTLDNGRMRRSPKLSHNVRRRASKLAVPALHPERGEPTCNPCAHGAYRRGRDEVAASYGCYRTPRPLATTNYADRA